MTCWPPQGPFNREFAEKVEEMLNSFPKILGSRWVVLTGDCGFELGATIFCPTVIGVHEHAIRVRDVPGQRKTPEGFAKEFYESMRAWAAERGLFRE